MEITTVRPRLFHYHNSDSHKQREHGPSRHLLTLIQVLSKTLLTTQSGQMPRKLHELKGSIARIVLRDPLRACGVLNSFEGENSP